MSSFRRGCNQVSCAQDGVSEFLKFAMQHYKPPRAIGRRFGAAILPQVRGIPFAAQVTVSLRVQASCGTGILLRSRQASASFPRPSGESSVPRSGPVRREVRPYSARSRPHLPEPAGPPSRSLPASFLNGQRYPRNVPGERHFYVARFAVMCHPADFALIGRLPSNAATPHV